MLTRQRALYLVLGCAAIVATAVYFSNPLQAENRPLTDQEMANIFGRQPLPGGEPECNGCYLKVVGIACDGTDECYCVYFDSNCVKYSHEYEGFNTIDRFRSWNGMEEPNKDIESIKFTVCYHRFNCDQGIPVVKALCDPFQNECYEDEKTISICIPCIRGSQLAPNEPELHYCKKCK